MKTCWNCWLNFWSFSYPITIPDCCGKCGGRVHEV